MSDFRFCTGEVTDGLNPLQSKAVVLYYLVAKAYAEK